MLENDPAFAHELENKIREHYGFKLKDFGDTVPSEEKPKKK